MIVTFPVDWFTDIPDPAVIEVTAAPVRVVPPRTIDVALIIPVEPLIVIPVPTLIILLIPLRVILAGPMVTIPVTLASPFTNNVVHDAPTAPTSNANLGFVVPMPTNPLAVVVMIVPLVPTLSLDAVTTPTVMLGVPVSP